MRESFALRGAMRYLKEKHPEEELGEVLQICENLALDLSRKKGYLHPRALAAASSHIFQTRHGKSVTLEGTASDFRISSATLREYLRTFPTASALETAEKILENQLFGVELRESLKVLKVLQEKLDKKKNTLNPAALSAAAVYIYGYKDGREISIADVAKRFEISTSTLRDYVGAHEEAMDPVERAKMILRQYAKDEDLSKMYGMVARVYESMGISTARILAAIAYYLYVIDEQKYVTIEKVARDFNVSIPALRSYLEPYLSSISKTYLLFKRGDAYDVKGAVGQLNESETELLGRVYAKFGNNIFELSLLFDIPGVPRGRWQLFVRKMSRLGLLDIYKKPLDPKQYCTLVRGVSESLAKPERLERWLG